MKLKWYLAKHNLELKDLADKAFITPQYLSSVKNGRLKPSLKTARFICAATNGEVSIDELMNPQNYADPF